MTERRRPAATRTLSLAPYGDDLKDCYAVFVLARFEEMTQLTVDEQKHKSVEDQLKFRLEIAKKHFVRGQINVLDDNGQVVPAEMVPDDLGTTPGLVQDAYMTIIGVTPDPKVTSTTMVESPTSPDTNEQSPSENSSKTS